ncbi:ABC transporter permease subunit [Ruegeria sp.]|uniref:ABC transporter permease n=1 Tax=Ruegeria sp. TaxID=1879320 RepID=UPI002312CDF0|nr:ABC transporter permease subunit [Ruegeria sp.]MDA7965555.1 ABC transporter permease subunit [Ruegeria sp.]MDA7965579.1 ABC transporter permease subunit [Ruegeria sp.]
MSESQAANWLDPFSGNALPIAQNSEKVIMDFLVENRSFFNVIKEPVEYLLVSLENTLTGSPPLVVLACAVLIAWQMAGRNQAIVTGVLLAGLGFIGPGMWEATMTTISVVLCSLFLCLLLGIPLGIWAGLSDRAYAIMRPILDTMQTIPSFVYLVPVAILFGVGNAPGVVVTAVHALPPVIRLTALGLRQVPEDVIEASASFGATPTQVLLKVRLPLSVPSIMVGVNQTLMMCLSMAVVASMIAVGGLGLEVLRAIGRLDVGLAIVSGTGIVVLAIILDRITQGPVELAKKDPHRKWYQHGPARLVWLLVRGVTGSKAGAPEQSMAADSAS